MLEARCVSVEYVCFLCKDSVRLGPRIVGMFSVIAERCNMMRILGALGVGIYKLTSCGPTSLSP